MQDALGDKLETLLVTKRKEEVREMQDVLVGKLDALLGEERVKKVCEDIALVLAKYGLVQSPTECELLFRYMIFVTQGWNSL